MWTCWVFSMPSPKLGACTGLFQTIKHHIIFFKKKKKTKIPVDMGIVFLKTCIQVVA